MQEPGTGQQSGTQQPFGSTQPAMNTSNNPGGYAPIPEPSGYIPPMQTGGDFNNDSGTGPTAKLPAELQGFSWAAALMGWIWAIGMKFWLGLLALPAGFILGMIPIVGFLAQIGLMVFFGMKGNEWAWQHRRWESIQQFRDTQRVWMYWGIALFVIAVILIIMAVALPMFVAMRNPQAFQPPGGFVTP